MKKPTTHFLFALALVLGSFLMVQTVIIPNHTPNTQTAGLFSFLRGIFSFPPSWDVDQCPDYPADQLVKNGGFEDGITVNTNFSLQSPDAETICGWSRDATGYYTWNWGVRYYSLAEATPAPNIMWPDVYGMANDSDNQRYVGLLVAEHTSNDQTHDFIAQKIDGLQSGEEYNLSFKYSVKDASGWTWPEQVGGVPSLGVFIAFLSDEQVDQLPYHPSYGALTFLDGYEDYADIGNFVDSFGSQVDMPVDVVYISPENEFEYQSGNEWLDFEISFTTIPQEGFDNLVIMPIGYDPEYQGSSEYKAKAVLLVDDVKLEPRDLACSFTSEQSIFYVDSSGELAGVPVNSNVLISDLGNFSNSIFEGLNDLVPTFAVGLAGDGQLIIDSLVNETFTQEEIEEIFDFTGLEIVDFTPFSGGQHFITFECVSEAEENSTCNNPMDLNNDGEIDEDDVEEFMDLYPAQCENGVGCEGDFNEDGLVNPGDLTQLLSSFGPACSGYDPCLTETQADAILNLMNSFGAPQETRFYADQILSGQITFEDVPTSAIYNIPSPQGSAIISLVSSFGCGNDVLFDIANLLDMGDDHGGSEGLQIETSFVPYKEFGGNTNRGYNYVVTLTHIAKEAVSVNDCDAEFPYKCKDGSCAIGPKYCESEGVDRVSIPISALLGAGFEIESFASSSSEVSVKDGIASVPVPQEGRSIRMFLDVSAAEKACAKDKKEKPHITYRLCK